MSEESCRSSPIIRSHLLKAEQAAIEFVAKNSCAFTKHDIIPNIKQIQVHDVQGVYESILANPCSLYDILP